MTLTSWELHGRFLMNVKLQFFEFFKQCLEFWPTILHGQVQIEWTILILIPFCVFILRLFLLIYLYTFLSLNKIYSSFFNLCWSLGSFVVGVSQSLCVLKITVDTFFKSFYIRFVFVLNDYDGMNMMIVLYECGKRKAD